MNAIPYDRPEEDWEHYEDLETDQPLPSRPRRQFFNRRSAALIALLLGAVCFYAGVRVEKTQMPSSSSTATRAFTAGSTAAGSGAAAGTRTGAGGAGAAAGLFGGGGRASGGAAAAFGGGNASIGTVSNVNGNSFYVTDTSGNLIKVTLSSATKVTKSVGVSKSSVRPGDTVVVRGLKNSNGTLSATSVSDSGAGASGFGGGGGGSSSGGSNGGSSAVGSLFGSGGGG